MGRKPYEDRFEERVDREAERFVDRPARTGLRWLLILIAVIAVVSIIGGCAAWIGGYGSEAKRVTGVENVRDQNTQILDLWENMDAAAQNVCDVGSQKKGEGDPTFVEDPTLAYKATYRKAAAEYNRRMENLYEAQAVRSLPLPSNLRGLPERAPTLSEKLAEIC